MSDFRKLAADARAAHDADAAAKEAALQAERQARHVEVERQKALLETHIIPRLEKAGQELKAEGIELWVERKYDVEQFLASVAPTLKLTCKGPKRSNDGWQWETPAVIFEPQGERINLIGHDSTYVSMGGGRTLISEDAINADPVVELAITRLVEQYFAELKKHH